MPSQRLRLATYVRAGCLGTLPGQCPARQSLGDGHVARCLRARARARSYSARSGLWCGGTSPRRIGRFGGRRGVPASFAGLGAGTGRGLVWRVERQFWRGGEDLFQTSPAVFVARLDRVPRGKEQADMLEGIHSMKALPGLAASGHGREPATPDQHSWAILGPQGGPRDGIDWVILSCTCCFDVASLSYMFMHMIRKVEGFADGLRSMARTRVVCRLA